MTRITYVRHMHIHSGRCDVCTKYELATEDGVRPESFPRFSTACDRFPSGVCDGFTEVSG